MKLKIDDKILEKFPRVTLGVVVVKGMDNISSSDEIIGMLRKQEKEIRDNFEKGTLSENSKINAWRKTYSSFGAKPKKYKCSVENLYRMILDGIELKPINKVVDIYNYISIKHIVPVGGDDIDNVSGDITLKFADGSEKFRELNSDDDTNPKDGEVVYMDEKEVLCRRWNWRECDKSKMTSNTKNVTLVVEGMAPVTKSEIESIINELAELVFKHCGGEITKFVLDKDNPAVDVS